MVAGEHPDRQLLLGQGAVHEVAEVGRLRGADEEQLRPLFDVVGPDGVHLVAALGEVGGPVEGALAHQERRHHHLVAAAQQLPGQQLLQAELHPGRGPADVGEAGAGDLGGLGGLHADGRPEVGVLPRRELAACVQGHRRHGGGAVAAASQLFGGAVPGPRDPHLLLGVVGLVVAVRHAGVGPVGKPVEDLLPLAADLAELGFEPAPLLAQLLPPAAGGIGVGPAEPGELLLLAVYFVDLRLQPAAFPVEGEPAVDVRLARIDAAQPDRPAQGIWVVANGSYIDHRIFISGRVRPNESRPCPWKGGRNGHQTK